MLTPSVERPAPPPAAHGAEAGDHEEAGADGQRVLIQKAGPPQDRGQVGQGPMRLRVEESFTTENTEDTEKNRRIITKTRTDEITKKTRKGLFRTGRQEQSLAPAERFVSVASRRHLVAGALVR
jgi:hypothetical protein